MVLCNLAITTMPGVVSQDDMIFPFPLFPMVAVGF